MLWKHGCGALILPSRCKNPDAYPWLTQMPKDGILLFQRGATAPTFAGCWGGPGGIKNPGETPQEAAKRETLEETGIKFFPDEDPVFDGQGDDRWLSYFAGAWVAPKQIKLQTNEVAGYGYFPYSVALSLPLSFKYWDAINILAAA